MLDAEPVIHLRVLMEHGFVRVEDRLDRGIAVAVGREVGSREHARPGKAIDELLVAQHLEPVEARLVEVRVAERGGVALDRSVGDVLERAQGQPVVAKARVEHELAGQRIGGEQRRPDRQVAIRHPSLVCVKVREARGHADERIVNRCHTDADGA